MELNDFGIKHVGFGEDLKALPQDKMDTGFASLEALENKDVPTDELVPACCKKMMTWTY
jgi:hypothetical protein